MLDRERADFFRALESLQSAFGNHVVATEIPIGSEHEVRGVIDLIDMKAFVAQGEGRGAPEPQEIPEELAGAGAGVPREADGRGGGELRRAHGALPRGRGDRPRRDRHGAQAGGDRRQDLPRHLRRRDQEPRHHPAAGGAGRGPALASDAGRGHGPRRGGRGDRDRARRGRPARRLRLQDPRRSLRRAAQSLPRLLGRPQGRLAGHQRDPPGQGADRPAPRSPAARSTSRSDELGPGTSAPSPS